MPDRWLVLAHEATNSGAPRMLLEILRAVRAARGPSWQCEILLDRGGPLAAALAEFGPLHRLTPPWAEGSGLLARILRAAVVRPWLKPRRFRRLVGDWRQRGPGIVYSNTATNGRLLAQLPVGAGPVVTHVHELAYGLQRFNRPRDLAATWARTDLFLAVSQAAAADLRDFGVPAARLRVVPNFLADLPRPPATAAARAEVAARLRLGPDTRIVTGCGHVDPIKGTDLFVAMVRRLQETGTVPVIGAWIGGDIDRAFAARVRAAAGPRVHFVGAVPDPLPWFAASDVVAVTSRVESFSRVALEAAGLGRPVLAFAAARGPADLLPAEALVRETSAAAMADAVAGLLANPDHAQRYGAALRERVAADFLAPACMPRLLAAIAEVTRG